MLKNVILFTCLLFEKKLISDEDPGDIGVVRLGELLELDTILLDGSEVSQTDNREFGFILYLDAIEFYHQENVHKIKEV